MSRACAIQMEMASAVRVLGGCGPAKEQNTRAARLTRLSATTIERLRWKKVKRVPADVADAVREALHKYTEGTLARAQHELFIERQRSAALLAYLEQSNPDFYRPEIDCLRREAESLGRGTHPVGGE
jgi:hypothetical protein